MTLAEIVSMIENALSNQGIDATNIALANEDEIPKEEGSFKLNFSYDEDGTTKEGVLNLNVVNSKQPEKLDRTILTASELLRKFDKDELLKLISSKLLNKGIRYENLRINSEDTDISASGTYNISFSYESDGLVKEGELHLTLEEEAATKTEGISPVIFIVAGVALAGIAIIIIARARKRRHA